MEPDYAAIREGLRLLRESKTPPNMFGGDVHRFQVHEPLSEVNVGDFETQFRVRLPAAYRGFLLHVGNGGAGPSYGMFKLGKMDNDHSNTRWKEDDGFVGILANPFPHSEAWNETTGMPHNDASGETDSVWEDEFERQMDAWEEVYFDTQQVNGAIPICHLGCAYRQWLIISGPETGNVWDDNRSDYRGLKPLQQYGRQRVTFIQWYGDWLNSALEQLGVGFRVAEKSSS